MSLLEADSASNSALRAVESIASGTDFQSDLIRLSDLDRAGAARATTALENLDEPNRAKVVLSLVDAADQSVELNFNRIFRNLLDDSNAEVRRLAIQGLWEENSSELTDKYLDLLQHDSDADVRAQAAVALQEWCADLADSTERGSDNVNTVAQLLTVIADDKTESPIVRRRAIEALGALNAPSRTELVLRQYSRDDDQALAAGALRGMGLSGNRKWNHYIEDSLASEDAELRYEAAGAAGMIGDVDFVPALASLMQDDDAEVQAAAALALGRISGDAALRVLEAHVDSAEDPDVVRAAIEEARMLDDPLTENL